MSEESHWHECDCGEKSNQAAHTYGEWETVKEATETEDGLMKHICSVCGYEEYGAISASGTVTPDKNTTESDKSDIDTPDTSKPTPTAPEKPGDSFPWQIIVAVPIIVGGIALIAAITAIIVVIVKKKKKKQE